MKHETGDPTNGYKYVPCEKKISSGPPHIHTLSLSHTHTHTPLNCYPDVALYAEISQKPSCLFTKNTLSQVLSGAFAT